MLKRSLFAPILITLAASADAQVCLVSEGHPRGVVVTADAPSKTATYAAEELVRHVRLATGVELRVVKESQLVPLGECGLSLPIVHRVLAFVTVEQPRAHWVLLPTEPHVVPVGCTKLPGECEEYLHRTVHSRISPVVDV